MSDDNKGAKTVIRKTVKGSAKFSGIGTFNVAKDIYGEATYKRLAEDIAFLHKEIARPDINEQLKVRYSRFIIILLPFYLESMSRLVFDELANKPLDRTGLPEPIQRFRAIYKEVLGGELPLDIDGIRDLFTVRNKITAHPTGYAQLEGVNRIDKKVGYRKLTSLPQNYSSFTSKDADIALDEAVSFITKFLSLLRGKIPEDKLKFWWPSEF